MARDTKKEEVAFSVHEGILAENKKETHMVRVSFFAVLILSMAAIGS
jgi:hypothetical protein